MKNYNTLRLSSSPETDFIFGFSFRTFLMGFCELVPMTSNVTSGLV